jgi:hypothetical protein
MTDLTYRIAETRGTPARALAHRLRAGFDHRRVELAARLGHAASMEHYPDAELVDWSVWEHRHAALVEAHAIDYTLPARLAADWAESMLTVWAPRHPGDLHARKAISAARAWVDCPCVEHQDAARVASILVADGSYYAAAATSSAHAAASAAASSADAAYYATRASCFVYDAAVPADARSWQVAHFAAVLLN